MPQKKELFKPKQSKCPLCKETKLKKYAIINRFTPQFHLDQCEKCSHIFMNPVWEEKTNKKFYSEKYFSGKADYSFHDERKNSSFERVVWNARIEKIRSFISNGNFCDVGCSFGGFLSEASQFFNVYGIDISPYVVSHIKEKRDISIFQGNLENAPWQNGFFDVITAIEVIEHIEEPELFLTKAGNLLKPGGLLVLQTADFDGWQAINAGKNYNYFLPGHLHYYSAKNLKAAMKKWAKIDNILEFRGTEFGLLPKLKKSRGNFNKWYHYLKWIRISFYHLLSKLKWRGRYLTSAMVLYGFKKDNNS